MSPKKRPLGPLAPGLKPASGRGSDAALKRRSSTAMLAFRPGPQSDGRVDMIKRMADGPHLQREAVHFDSLRSLRAGLSQGSRRGPVRRMSRAHQVQKSRDESDNEPHPQGLKPRSWGVLFGTAEAVPSPKQERVCQASVRPNTVRPNLDRCALHAYRRPYELGMSSVRSELSPGQSTPRVRGWQRCHLAQR